MNSKMRARPLVVATIVVAMLGALLFGPTALPAQQPAANVAAVPPPGGLTTTIAGTDDITALIAAQQFEVEAVWALDVATQQFLVFIPGAPSFVNTLIELRASDVVSLKAASSQPASSETSSTPPSDGTPTVASSDDPCSNALGDGAVAISGPSVPGANDGDRVFRSLTVHPSDPDTVLMGTERNGFVLSTDGGTTWTRQRYGLRTFFGESYAEIWDIAYAPSDPSIVFAATLDSPGAFVGENPVVHAGIYKSTDGGRTWARKNCGLVSSRITAIRVDPSDPNLVIAGIEGGFPSYWQGSDPPYFDGGIFRSTDGGEQWTRVEIDVNDRFNGWVLETAATSPSTFVAIGHDFDDPSRALGVLRSTDGGLTWQPYEGAASLPPDVGSVALSASGEAIYLTAGGTYRHWVSRDGGAAWSSTAINQSNGPVIVSPDDADHVLFISQTKIYRSTNGLLTQSAATITHGTAASMDEPFRDIAFAPSNPSVVYAAKDGYLLYRSDDGGASFTFIVNIRDDVLNVLP